MEEAEDEELEINKLFDGGQGFAGTAGIGGRREYIWISGWAAGNRRKVTGPEVVSEGAESVFQDVKQGFDGHAVAIKFQAGDGIEV